MLHDTVRDVPVLRGPLLLTEQRLQSRFALIRVVERFSHGSQCAHAPLPTSHHLVMDDHEGSAQQMKGMQKFLTVNSVSDTCLAIGVFVVCSLWN